MGPRNIPSSEQLSRYFTLKQQTHPSREMAGAVLPAGTVALLLHIDHCGCCQVAAPQQHMPTLADGP